MTRIGMDPEVTVQVSGTQVLQVDGTAPDIPDYQDRWERI